MYNPSPACLAGRQPPLKLRGGIFILFILFIANVAVAKDSYKKVLKHETRFDRVFVMDNIEARLIAHATYFSSDFCDALKDKVASMVGGDVYTHSCDQGGTSFFVGLYSGSGKWPEIGRDDGSWAFMLEEGDGRSLKSASSERINITQTERELFPYLDKWSKGYLVCFKTISEHPRLKIVTPSASSTLVW